MLRALTIDVPFAAPPPSDGPIIKYTDGTTLQELLREEYPKMFGRSTELDSSDNAEVNPRTR